MRLKVGVVDSDITYIEKFIHSVQTKLSDEIELYVYSDAEQAYQGIKNVYLDVLLVSDEIEFDRTSLPKGIAFIYFTKKNNVEEISGIPAISKYHQKLNDIYKEILAIYAETSTDQSDKKKKRNVKITLFTSVQGGAGTTVAAASYAVNKANSGKNVFFLSLDLFGDVSLYFTGDGKQSLTDVLNALKKNVNIEAKFSSAVKTDDSGVDFLDTCRNAYDMIELKDKEIDDLLEIIQVSEKEYEEIVIDYSCELNDRVLMLMTKYADSIVYVNDGSEIGNIKFQRFCEVIRVVEHKKEVHMLNKIKLLYNRFSSKTGEQLEETAVPVIGGINRIIGLSETKLIVQIAELTDVMWG